MKRPVAKNQTRLGLSILVTALAGALATGLCTALYWREASHVEKTLREREAGRLSLFEKNLQRDFQATYFGNTTPGRMGKAS